MEPTRQNNSINAIKDVRKPFNEIRSNLSDEETKRIRKKLRRIEAVYNVLKEKEQKSSLTSRQKNMLWNDERYLKNISKHLKNLKKHFKKNQYDYLYKIIYLMNPQLQIMILMHLKRLESFLMDVEVIFFVKK